MEEDLRYNRQALWFGVDGQDKIKNTRVAIIGTSGTGSHVVQQLAYLGIKKFILLDSDKVSPTNLNRLVGANDQDIEKPKVDIAKRLIEFVNPKAQVKLINDTFIAVEGVSALKDADFIFGCFDKDGARLILTEFCKAYRKPYLDIATEITEDNWGGRILFSDKEEGCLVCTDQLDQKEIRRDLSTPEDRSVDDKIYGVDQTKLSGSGPGVISLNGTLASLAVTEFIAYVTGIRPIKKHLLYRGNMGIVTTSSDQPLPDCYYCKIVAGIADKVDMAKYLRQGIDKFLR